MTITKEETDEGLAARAVAGSRSAFEELVLRYGGSVLALIKKRLTDEHQALDVAQEAWIRVFRALSSFDTERSFRSWLFSIVINGTRDEGRRRGRDRIVYLDDFREEELSDCGQAGDERDAIDTALGRVAEPFRSALMLIDVEGLAYEEAAVSLGCAVGTVKSRTNRGRLLFRDQWLRLSNEGAAERTGSTS